jgi:hypothetical protein
MLDQIDAAFSLLDRFKKYRDSKQSPGKEDSIPYRFILLFEKHGVHRNQIPRFFGHGLTPEDVSSPEKLLSKLTHDVLQAASDLFAIRLEWLECADNTIYPIYQHQFYQAPECFRQFLTDLQSNGDRHRLSAHFVVSNHSKQLDYNALLFVKEAIGELGDTQISRYHLCSHQWTHQYWKARADLAACAAIACATLGDAWGFQTAADISDFDRGERFMSDIDTLPNQRKISKNPKRKAKLWRPEDWAADPESFLDGVDEGIPGKKAALARWLEYANAGYMNTKFPEYANAPERFAEMLERLNR